MAKISSSPQPWDRMRRITDISATAGVAHGTFYTYFTSKEEIFRVVWNETSVTDNALTRAIAQIRKALEDNPRQPRELLPRLGHLRVAAQRPGNRGALEEKLLQVAHPVVGGIHHYRTSMR